MFTHARRFCENAATPARADAGTQEPITVLPLTGYADRLSVRPGETIRFHLANATGAEVEAKLVRVVCADANPAGPGVVVEPVAGPPAAVAAAGEQRVPRGSYARIEDVGRCLGAGGFSIICLVHPTRLAGRRQAIVSRTGAGHAGASETDGSRVGASHPDALGADARVAASRPGASGADGPPTGDPSIGASSVAAVVPGCGFTLAIDERDRLCASIGDGEAMHDVAVVPRPLTERSWQAVWLVVDTGAGEARIGWAATSSRLGETPSPHVARAPLPLFQINVEEGRHLWAMVYLLHAHFGRDGREEAEALLERRSGDAESELYAVSVPQGVEPPLLGRIIRMCGGMYRIVPIHPQRPFTKEVGVRQTLEPFPKHASLGSKVLFS